MTTVENFKNLKRHWNRESQTWDDDTIIYIGRRSTSYNLPQSEWANPYQMGSESQRQSVIDLYRGYIQARIKEGKLDLESLRGKTLVCWCHPKGCHGDVLKELLGELE